MAKTKDMAGLAEETIGSKIEHLLPSALEQKSMPKWPPDVFCLVAAILHSSGAYSRVVEHSTYAVSSRKRNAAQKQLGKDWAKSAAGDKLPPKKVRDSWTIVVAKSGVPLSRLGSLEETEVREALLELLAASDEACLGAGMYNDSSQQELEENRDDFRLAAEETLVFSFEAGQGTLCRDIHPSRARVLPKCHTPQNGLTIRSLSHNVGYCTGSDMQPNWVNVDQEKSHCLNLLFIPWPKELNPSAFASTKKNRITDRVQPGGYGLFTVGLTGGPTPQNVRCLMEAAESKVGPVGGLLFPELSMNKEDFDAISDAVISSTRFVVGGVGRAAQGASAGSNEAHIHVVDPKSIGSDGEPMRYTYAQRKHHRWKLDKAQIGQYGIGTNLHPEANWWEHIELGAREINFLTLQPWLTMSVLICEDLARPDPVGEVIRAVGPNLIIALLSDGPQITSRWPGRYAGAFADDPGSSVLTVTSKGMSSLSRPSDKSKDRSDVVALWRDARTGSTEISCPADVAAVVLNITVEYHDEWTADGRGGALGTGKSSGYPVLSGYHLIRESDVKAKGASDDDSNLQRSSDPLPHQEAAEADGLTPVERKSTRRSKARRG